MNILSHCLKISLTALSAAATAFSAPSSYAKGYTLSPLESYLIEAFAQEQIEGFIHTGTSSLFENPKVYYLQPKKLARFAVADASKASSQYVGKYAVIDAHVFQVIDNREKIVYSTKKPNYSIVLTVASQADKKLLEEVFPGSRHGFYCKIDTVTQTSAELSECLPLRQFTQLKSSQIENIIHRYLKGEKINDPNMPTYAMMAYMAIVSAKLLPAKSVCRTTVIEEVTYTPAERRLCTQEVSELWQNAGMNPHFDATMDHVEDQLKKDGVDVTPIKEAASMLD